MSEKARDPMACKEGCIQDGLHRTPIDCVTVPDLWKALEEQREEVKTLEAQAVAIKAKLYDLEHEDER